MKNLMVDSQGERFHGVRNVAAGKLHTVLLKHDGTVWTTGSNNYGQLGFPDPEKTNVPLQVNIDNVVQVAAGDYFTIFLKADGTVWGSGFGESGVFGIGDRNNVLLPTQMQ